MEGFSRRLEMCDDREWGLGGVYFLWFLVVLGVRKGFRVMLGCFFLFVYLC